MGKLNNTFIPDNLRYGSVWNQIINLIIANKEHKITKNNLDMKR